MTAHISGKENLADLDIDELVERLTPGEIQKLLDEADPDDPNIPPSLRCNYKCDKPPSDRPFDKNALNDFIRDQALNEPDVPDVVPHIAGTLRGRKFNAPAKPKPRREEEIELDIDLGEDVEIALSSASTDEIVDLAGIMGLHSMMNQDQYHASQSDKVPRADPTIGWRGVTKATELKPFPNEAPNKTDPDEALQKIKANDPKTTVVNMNNIPVAENTFIELFDALERNNHLTELQAANSSLTDAAATILASALETNKTLEKVNIETNHVSPQTLARILEAMAVHQTVTEFKAANQQAQFLGNKVEVAMTKAIESNKTILKVGLHFQYGDTRNRVAIALQKNLDRLRLKRIAQKMSTGNNPYPNGSKKNDSDGNYSDDE
jgi:tropomodulin